MIPRDTSEERTSLMFLSRPAFIMSLQAFSVGCTEEKTQVKETGRQLKRSGMYLLCENIKNLQGPLQTTYHVYTMKYSGSTFPCKHTSILEVVTKLRATCEHMVACQTQPQWDSRLENISFQYRIKPRFFYTLWGDYSNICQHCSN